MNKKILDRYEREIPDLPPQTFEEISKQMRINQEIICQEITDHVNIELIRLKKEIALIREAEK